MQAAGRNAFAEFFSYGRLQLENGKIVAFASNRNNKTIKTIVIGWNGIEVDVQE